MPDDMTPASSTARDYNSNPFSLIWAGFKALAPNIKALILIVLASAGLIFVLLIPGLVVLLVAAGNKSAILGFIGAVLILVAIVAAIVVGVRLLAASYLLYLANSKGEAHHFRHFYVHGKPFAWRLVGLNILLGIMISFGFLVFIVPGLVFLYWFSLSPYILIERDCTIKEALSGSRALVRGHGWEMYGLFGAFQLVSLLQYIPIAGFIITTMLAFSTNTTYALRYRQLLELPPGHKSPVQVWNYITTILGPIALVFIIGVSTENVEHNLKNLPKATPASTTIQVATPTPVPTT